MKRKKLVSTLSVAFLLGGAPALAGSQKLDPKRTDSPAVSQAQARSVVGTVKEYQPGKILKVATSRRLEAFKLDDQGLDVKINTSINVGQTVKVVEMTTLGGQRTLTVEAQKPAEMRS